MQHSLTLIPYTISWNTPVDGSKIDKYQVRFAIHDSGYSDWIDLEGADTRFVALLPNDAEITIEIRTVNDAGPGKTNILQIRPVKEPDGKKQIGDGSVPIHLENIEE